jgi:3-deoxy-D-manno-octulosonic-acid transferase
LPAGAQLLVAPRKPEWFDVAAQAMAPCTRRSDPDRRASEGRFLLDSIGELRAAYALADVVVIGRSFGRLYGSDMMEPVALGKPTVVGPRVADFRETVAALEEGGGLVRTDAAGLPEVLDRLLADPHERHRLAEAGRRVIRARQGATERNAALLMDLFSPVERTPVPAESTA